MSTSRASLSAFSLIISALLSLHCSSENPPGTSSTSSSSSSGSTEAGGNGNGGNATGGNGMGGNGTGGMGTGGMAMGGAGGSGGMIQPEGMAVAFPPLASLTPASQLSARGTTEASFGITAVTVASVAATSNDNFATWQAADVPLALGAQSLAVNATGSLLAMHPPLKVERNDVVEAPDDLAFDVANNRAFATSSYGWPRFYTIDLDTGKASHFATFDVADGMALCALAANPFERSIAYDPVADDLLAINPQCIVRVNLQTGVRTLLTSGYPSSFTPRDLAVDSAKGRALVLDYDALYAVDLSNGAFSVISDTSTGSGPSLDKTSVMAPDLANGRALVLQGDGMNFGLIAVDLSNGNRTVLASSSIGSGPTLYSPHAAAYDPVGNRTLASDNTRILAIDHATGNRTVLSDQNNTGPVINTPTGLALDGAKGRLIETDLESHILAIDLATGNRSTLYDYAVGTGPSVRVAYVTTDPVTGDVYAAPVGTELLHMDRWGNRTVISSSGAVPVGTGPSINQMRGIWVHRPNDEVVVVAGIGMFSSLVSVNRSTGNRTELSSANLGTGPAFSLPQAVVVHPSGNPIWVIDTFANALFQVDRTTGDRTIIADNSSVGSGPTFSLSTMGYDGTNLIVMGQGSVLAIDPATGDRTIISGVNVGTGPQLAGTMLAVNPTGTTIYTVFSGRVMSVDKATGNRAMLVNLNVGRGPLAAYSFAHVGPNGIIWLSGDAGYSIGALDPVTGDRVIAAK